MRKIYVLTAILIALSFNSKAQKKPVTTPGGTVAVDSSQEISNKEIADEGQIVVALDDNELDNGSNGNVSSMLSSGRDPFYNAVFFNFFPVHYKYRGYDSKGSDIYMNGIPLENLENGYSQFGLFGGLNDVTHNRDMGIGIKGNTFAYGAMGVTTNFDTRASKQRKQTQFGYSFMADMSHRWSLTHSTGMNSKGWAFTGSISRRWSDEGYVAGTYVDNFSYFGGVDKKINGKHMLSLVVFNSNSETGRQTYETKEAFDLAGSHFYNSAWGYQMGKKRNANITTSNMPVAILSHEFKINTKTTLLTSAAYTSGDKGFTFIDYPNAADPRPDYYAYMPSYWLYHNYNDIGMYNLIANKWSTDESVRQIDWNTLYQSNRSDRDTISGQKGHRSHYLMADNVTSTKRFNFNTTFNTTISQRLLISGGLSYQTEVNEHYKLAKDLLGGDYMVDQNTFAQFNFPTTPQYNQSNIIVKKGGKYGYDYEMNLQKAAAWAQGVYKFNNLDVFVAAEVSNTQFFRNGLFLNTLFPTTSLGKSTTYNFNNYSFKGGLTYKINGRNYLYINEYFATVAPGYTGVYLSPGTRSQAQDQVSSESIKSMEAGYFLVTPKVKMKVSGYYTETDNEMQVRSYYDDELGNFVNVALRNISKVHYGVELGTEVKPINNVTVSGAVGISRSYFNSRQFATTTIDNVDSVVSRDSVYSKNYRIGSTPQEVFTLGINYRSPNYWYVGISANYYDDLWVDMSPIRREYRISTGAPYHSAQWRQIVDQEQLPGNFMMNLNAGFSWKVPKSFGLKRTTFVAVNLGINNLLNNENIVASGREQLRFDSKYFQAGAFPNKYSYAMGINYHIGASIRF